MPPPAPWDFRQILPPVFVASSSHSNSGNVVGICLGGSKDMTREPTKRTGVDTSSLFVILALGKV